MARALLLFDVDQIQSYVFATDRLREIVGASHLIDSFNRQGMLAAVRREGVRLAAPYQDRPIYANGGQGMFLLADEADVPRAIHAVQTECRRRAPGATVSASWIPVEDDFQPDGPGYGERGRELGRRLAESKLARTGSVLVSLPILRPCDESGTEPAVAVHDQFGCIGVSVQAKLDAAASLRAPGGSDAGPWSRLQDHVPADWRDSERPQELTVVGEASERPGFVALLYADGNDMGRRVQKCRSLAELERLAKAVDESLHQALGEALGQEHLVEHLVPPGSQRPARRFEPLLLGGDDLVLVLPAQCAIDVASKLVDRYAELTAERLGQSDRLTLSVGIACAHAKFPFRSLLDLAKSVLKHAKKAGYQDSDPTRIGFLLVTSPNHLSFEDYVDADLSTEHQHFLGQEYRVVRTMRPYRPAELALLRQAADGLRRAPRSKLHQLRSAVLETPSAAAIQYLTALLHWPSNQGSPSRLLRDLAELAAPGSQPVACWLPSPGVLRTPLLDVVELLDLVPRG